MIGEKIRRAYEHYQREGGKSLLTEIDKRFRSKVPLQYRLKIRRLRQVPKWGSAAVYNPVQIYYVDPGRIQYNGPRFERTRYIGTVQSGEWDQRRSELGGTTLASFKTRFVEGKPWEDTALYQKAKRRIREKGYYLGYRDFNRFEHERLSYLDELFADIRENGYRTQRELAGKKRDTNRHVDPSRDHFKTHEVGCNIARDGTLLFNSGKHRLAIAKLLELEELPIQIIVRHPNWMAQRQQIVSASDPEAVIEQNELDPQHPDLMELFKRTS